MHLTIEQFSNEAKTRGLIPSNIQLSSWQDWTLVSCFTEDDSLFISEKVTMGIDRNPKIALMKGLTEFCERKIMHSASDPIAKLTERSDGFAALPKYYESSIEKARINALDEAIERYLWATWWDNSKIKFFISEDFALPNKNQLFIEFKLEKIFSVHIFPDNSPSSLLILIAKIKGKGYVTGGAAGNVQNKEQVFSRAFGELLRHLIVVSEMFSSSASPTSFYEKRLYGFGVGNWNKEVENRLCQNGNKTISLPSLIADKEIPHANSDFIVLYRCLFENQPIFMGGKLERLCI